MAYIDRVKPEDYNALIAAFGQVGAPVCARVCELINKQRHAVGNHKRIAFVTVKKAWEKGWVEQTDGRPAPAIKTLFPNWQTPETEHNNPPAERPGAAPVGVHDAASQGMNAARHEELVESLAQSLAPKLTAMIPATSTQALRVDDPASEIARRVEAGMVPARANEMTVLANTRRNLLGLQEVSGTIIAELAKKKQFLIRMVSDLEGSDVPTLRTMRETLRELIAFEKDLTLAIKNNQESQRLLEGAPQRIEERRSTGNEDTDTRALARLASMLRTRLETADKYDGEDSDPAQDVEFTDATNEGKNDLAPGEQKANEDDPAT